jgi:hypothetical protein
MTVSHYILFRMKNILDKSCRENQNTHFLSNNFFFENRVVHEIMPKTLVEPEATNDVTVWRIRVACWISKTIQTHARTRMTMPKLPATHTRTYARTRTHTDKYNNYCFPTAAIISETASMCCVTP